MKSYHFDCGNSTFGSIGFCARVEARSREEAVELLNESLPEEVQIELDPSISTGTRDGKIVYATVYFGRVKVHEIDEENDIDE